MQIVMAGSSGFLGTHLRERLDSQGHEVTRLIRREPDPSTSDRVARWAPGRGELDPSVLAGADAVVNLSGAGINDRRWTEKYKAVIRDSRVLATRTLAETIATLPEADRPEVLLNASGVHFYGPTGETVADETAPHGTGFMPELCVDWEAAAEPARAAGVRVVSARTGLVLDRATGVLKFLVPIYRLGFGGPIGHGRQWMPWITLRDWLSAAIFTLEHTDIDGPVNFTGPHPSRNAEFTRALGRAVHRPAIVPVPAFGVRLVLGEFGNEAIDSLRVVPRALTGSGFAFQDTDLGQALRLILGRSAVGQAPGHDRRKNRAAD